MKVQDNMQQGRSRWARLACGLGLLIALALAVPVSAQDAPPLFTSGIFRATVPGVKTQVAQWVPDTEFFKSGTGTIASMGAAGYTLTDLDIDTSTGQRYYSAIFKSGVPTTQYWELAPAAFSTKLIALAQQKIYLISLHTYVSPANGQLFYSGVFQPGTGPEMFSGELGYTEFSSWVETNARSGYFPTSVAVYDKGGESYYVGVLRGGLKQGDSQYEFFEGGWDLLANQTLVNAANGLRLVSLSHDRPGNYAGSWVAGTDPFEVVAATTDSVFSRKVTELAAAGLSPVRILIEGAYEPPVGLAAALFDQLYGATGGFSYSVSEKGSLTAEGGQGYARTLSDKPITSMDQNTRLDLASVTKWVAAVATYKALETHPGYTLDTPIMNILGNGVLDGSKLGEYVNKVTIKNLLNMDSGIYEGSCGAGNAPGYYSNPAWLACTLSNCTRPYPYSSTAGTPPINCQPPGPNIPSAYSDGDFGVLRDVVEHITGESFESYVHSALFVPLGIDGPSYSATDIRNSNCHPDLVTEERPLYYFATQTSGPGLDDQEYNGGTKIPASLSTERSVAVCGSGGLQMTADQAGKFWNGLMHGKLIKSCNIDTVCDLTSLLNDWVINQSGAVTWSGQGYAKNGGYTVYNNQGPNADVVAVPATDTQVALFTNTEGNLVSGFTVNPQETIVDGLDWMGFHPVDTVSIVNQNSAAFGPMCFNVKGGGAAQNTPIIQWTCGPKPLPANELFTRVGSVSEPGLFMLQVPQTLWSGTPMCITSEYDATYPSDPMILYACNGGNNQWFKLGQQTASGFSTLVIQSTQQCLAVDDNSIYSGANIVQEPCDPAAYSQGFSLQSVTAE